MKVCLRKIINKRVLYKNLTPGKTYQVLSLECDSFCMINDMNEPISYPCAWFEITDPREPEDWAYGINGDGDLFARPKGLDVYIFEDWHEKINNAREILANYLQTLNEQKYRNNYLRVGEQEYPIVKREWNLSEREGSLWLYFKASLFKGGGFGFWEFRLNELKSIDELDGQRLHLDYKWEPCRDDTLGTEVWRSKDYLDIHCLTLDSQDDNYFHYGEILIDFEKIDQFSFRFKLHMSLTKSLEDPENLIESDFSYCADGDFVAAFDRRIMEL